MNIKNTMCRLSELTSEQIDILRNAMPKGQYDFFTTENVIGATSTGKWGTWDVRGLKRNIITYTEMMKLLGKTMREFTKSDLKAGVHFVKSEDGRYWAVLDKVISYADSFMSIERYSDNLKLESSSTTDYDIVAVYAPKCRSSIDYYLKGQYLTPIWERTEQTPAQKEMKVLQAQIDKGAAYMTELHEQAKRLQAKL
jgi:hypothetical protein